MYNILIAVRLFVPDIKDSTVHLRTDNASAAVILQTGKGKCKNMMNAARQIWAIAHEHNILFKVSHIFGRDNVFADVLSRAHLSKEDAKKLKEL